MEVREQMQHLSAVRGQLARTRSNVWSSSPARGQTLTLFSRTEAGVFHLLMFFLGISQKEDCQDTFVSAVFLLKRYLKRGGPKKQMDSMGGGFSVTKENARNFVRSCLLIILFA